MVTVIGTEIAYVNRVWRSANPNFQQAVGEVLLCLRAGDGQLLPAIFADVLAP